MAWLRSLVADAEASTSSSNTSGCPAKADKPSRSTAHRLSMSPPGMRLTVAITPGFTIGLVGPLPFSTAYAELNGRPVASTPTTSLTAAAPSRSQAKANTNGRATARKT